MIFKGSYTYDVTWYLEWILSIIAANTVVGCDLWRQSCQPWKLNQTLLRVLTSQASWSQSPSRLLSCFPFGSSFVARLSSLLSHFHWLLDVSSEMGNVHVACLYGFKQLTHKKKNTKGISDFSCYRVKSRVPPRRKTGDLGTRSNQKNQYGSPFKGNLGTSKLWK